MNHEVDDPSVCAHKKIVFFYFTVFSYNYLNKWLLMHCRYRDPKTGLPYATKEAFQMIRERYFFSILMQPFSCIFFLLYCLSLKLSIPIE